MNLSLSVLVGASRPPILDTWRESFRAIPTFTFQLASAEQFWEVEGVDALLILGFVAHDRDGAKAEPRTSEVLKPPAARRNVKWVVTTPAASAQLRLREDNRGVEVTPRVHLTAAESTYLDFREIFRAIRTFNGKGKGDTIHTLGVHLDLINAPLGDPRAEAEAVKRAYLEEIAGPATRHTAPRRSE